MPLLEQIARAREQHLTLRAEHRPAALQLKQPTTQRALQLTDLIAHSRLAAIKCFRRASIAAVIDYGCKRNPLISRGLW
jgi:hypothetical protein